MLCEIFAVPSVHQGHEVKAFIHRIAVEPQMYELGFETGSLVELEH